MGSSSQGSQKSGGFTLISSGVPELPRNILDAVSQIQQYYVLEKEGSTIPQDFLTIAGAIDFMSIGTKTAVKTGFFSALLSPLMIGVFSHYIPIFGTFNPTLFDKIWAVIMNFSLTIAFAFFLAYVGRYYIGNITKSAIKNLFTGILIGAILKAVVIFMLFHTLYHLVLTPDKVAQAAVWLKDVIGASAATKMYYWILGFKKAFIIASWVTVLDTLIMISIPVTFVFFKARKTSTEIDNRRKWGFGV